MNCIDLHIHTTASDGTDPPRAAVEKAASLGLAAVSITDHGSVSGVPEAMRAGAELSVEVVPGYPRTTATTTSTSSATSSTPPRPSCARCSTG